MTNHVDPYERAVLEQRLIDEPLKRIVAAMPPAIREAYERWDISRRELLMDMQTAATETVRHYALEAASRVADNIVRITEESLYWKATLARLFQLDPGGFIIEKLPR